MADIDDCAGLILSTFNILFLRMGTRQLDIYEGGVANRDTVATN